MKNIFGVSFLILSLSVAYYFVIYLPQKDEKKMRFQNQYEMGVAEINRKNLQECYSQSDMNYHLAWEDMCYKIGKEPGCLLNNSQAEWLNEGKKESYRKCEVQFSN